MPSATTIDELVVVLGMDASQFNEEQKKALAAFKKAQEASEQAGKNIEQHWKKISDVFGVVKRGAIGIVAAFAGEEVARAIDHIAGMDNATGKMAKTIGIGISNLSEWKGMIRMIGGDAGNATSALAGLQDAIQHVKMGGGYFSPEASSLFNAMGVDPLKSSPDAILRAATSYFEKEVSSGRMTTPFAASRLGGMPGMNKDMIDLILKGAEEQKKLAKAARDTGLATDSSAKSAAEYTQKMAEFTLSLENLARVALPLATVITNLAAGLGKIVNNAFSWGFLPKDEVKALDEQWAAVRKRVTDRDAKTPSGSPADRVKPGAGVVSPAMSALASMIQADEPSLKQFTSFNDPYHAFTGSKHAQGLALDFTITDPTQANAVAARLREKLKTMGVGARVLDEYSKPSSRATAPHIHIQFDDASAASKFSGARGAATINNVGGPSKQSSSTTTTTIGQIQVNAPNAKNADEIAREIAPAVRRVSWATPANYGLTG